ncbi:MAG: HK97 gp10 family phage protein [Candidatus Choladocola sp.]|nr:HK97 gp10 family phage protein [Candidatus Choladocola sp.]
MAQFDVHGFDQILNKLDRLGQFERVAPKMMEAGMEVLQKEFIDEASKHRDTGEMVESIKPTGLIAEKNGSYYMCTRPTGYSKKRKNARKGKGEGKGKIRVRNMEKLVWLEYGVKGRAATPIVKKAVIRARAGVINAMRDVFNMEVGKI